MLGEFVETFGFQPKSLDPLLTVSGFLGGVENNLVALRIRAMKESRDEVEAEVKKAEGEKKIFWLGVLEAMNSNIHKAQELAREFEFLH